MESWAVLAGVLGILLEYFHVERVENDRRFQEAIETIQAAITETRKYIEREDTYQRDRSKELELSKLWGVASIRVQTVAPDLGSKLQLKKSYWENSAKLSRREIHQSGIALRQIQKEFDVLLSRKPSNF